MTLSDIKQLLTQRGEATLSEIATTLDTDPEATHAMLEYWQRRGRISVRRGERCRGCNQCSGAALELYQWGSHDHQEASS